MLRQGPSTNTTKLELLSPFKFVERFDLNFRVVPPYLAAKVSAVATLVRCSMRCRRVDWYFEQSDQGFLCQGVSTRHTSG